MTNARTADQVRERVLSIVRDLASETGGERARRSVCDTASLERDIGLGSLERVELLLRLEQAFGRALDENFLALDTPAALTQAIVDAKITAPQESPTARTPQPSVALSLPTQAETLCDVLEHWARSAPERTHVFLRTEDGLEIPLSYAKLFRDAEAMAGALEEWGVGYEDTVALMLPTGQDFLRAFFGVLMTGAIPVPIYPPPRLDQIDTYIVRQANILKDAATRLLITAREIQPVACALQAHVPTLKDVTTAAELSHLGAPWRKQSHSSSDTALIQYTSGSTGAPKGVALTHANLLANIRAIGQAVAMSPSDVGVSWLPLYHDMGLIGSWLACLYHGCPLVLFSPLAFLARPERWLRAIHEHRATLSAAPNFAYELCARKIADERLAGLDLSSWRAALNGAEAVHAQTLERFSERFRTCGFRAAAFLPVYGLAENSVALCFPKTDRAWRVDRIARAAFEKDRRAVPAAEDEPHPLDFVSVGTPLPGHTVRIVDDAGADLPERRVGRLLFRGPSTMRGYWRQPDTSAQAMSSDGFVDSGDLAYRADGEVFIAGRRKDLIIKAGRNLMPQEIEEAAGSVAGLRKGCLAAFGVPHEASGTERLVLVAETRIKDRAERERMIAQAIEAVAARVGLPPDEVVLTSPGTVPKTSSGKVRRAEARERYLQDRLTPAARPLLRLRIQLALAALQAGFADGARASLRGMYTLWATAVSFALLVLLWPLMLLIPRGRAALVLTRQ
ncbi:MAG: fatty acyl-AMP ligase, partial [Vicinamibacteria bacterium]|nr:fatty acyl-AMP ligase [Vicinamibacteria bacterium]